MCLVASCYWKRDKLQPDGPLGLYPDLTLVLPQLKTLHWKGMDIFWNNTMYFSPRSIIIGEKTMALFGLLL